MLLKTQESSSSQSQTASTWSSISKLTSTNGKGVTVDGHSLTISDVNAVAKSGVKVYLDESVKGPVQASVDFLEQKAHLSLYGITTGFGGSADTRTRDTKALQMSIIEHQLCGVLPVDGNYQEMLLSAMPIPIVRGAMLIRVNSLSRGHSGVRLKVLDAILAMLNLGLVPCVPLRGSISASGDLSPLSFVAGAICGHTSVSIFDTTSTPPSILSAPEAIAKYNLDTITLAAKEGLGILNGTAFSASAGAIALFEAEVLGMMAQAVTAMTVEAMMGHLDSFDPFISDIARPHWGQIEVARNVRTLLADSKFIVPEEGEVAIKDDIGTLRQDRYALRTSPQWIGPQLENLALARKQVEVELNSTTDNPLIDVEDGRFLHGGNFQAMSVTAAMESTRLAIQNLGRLSFAQVTELINCTMNGGLPSCLAGDEPSTNYHCKGLDIHCAAYTSELGYLANPVSTHVMSAEMHNQSVNSLALISARKTLEAAEIMRLLISTHLYCVCQAIDLRIIDLEFKQTMRKEVARSTKEHLAEHLNQDALATLQRDLYNAFIKRIEQTSSMDSGLRFEDAGVHCVGVLVEAMMSSGASEGLSAVSAWKTDFQATATRVYREIRDTAISGGDNVEKAEKMMGSTFALYNAVRRDIGVQVRKGDVACGKYGKSVGSQVSLIVNGLKNGKLVDAAMGMFEQS